MLSYLFGDKRKMPTAATALPGRSARPFPLPDTHAVLGTPLEGPFPADAATAMFGMGCFWGAERKFWTLPGALSTAVGYAAGLTTHPTYDEVCSGKTGHNEVVRVVYDPAKISYEALVAAFFEAHDPTQGMRQGNDVGTQYRSGIYTYDAAQRASALALRSAYEARLKAAGHAVISTEVIDAPEFYFAEGYHQQYLHKNPGGYCGLGGTGVSCPIGVDAKG